VRNALSQRGAILGSALSQKSNGSIGSQIIFFTWAAGTSLAPFRREEE
jgi:hypothetical protein